MTRAEKVLLGLLVVLVLFSPLFLGGVRGFHKDGNGEEPTLLESFLWAEGPWWIQMVIGAGIAAAALGVSTERRAAGEPEVWRLHPWIVLPFGGLVVLALLQAVPLPRFVLGLLSPHAAEELDRLLPGDRSWRPLTVSPDGTARALAGLALGGAVLLGALLVTQRRSAAVVLLVAVAAAFTGSACYGLASTLLGDDTVLGFQKGAGKGVTGTFLNRSNFAAAAGMALAVVLGLLWMALRRGPRAAALPLLGAVAALGLSVPLSSSRMGLLAAAAGLLAFGLLAARAPRWPAWARGLVALAALGVAAGGVAVALARLPGLWERFAQGRTDRGFMDVRFPAWRSTVVLAARYPVFGTGTGSFEVAIHETQTAENPDELVHAHCEPLEALAEGGLLGLALGILLAAGAAGACLRAAAGEDPLVRAVGCACGGALAALLAGCLTEFHLHVPALGVAAAVLAAVPAALAGGEPGPVPAAVPGRGRALILGGAVLLAGGLAALSGSRAAGLRGGSVRAEMAKDSARWEAAAGAAVEAGARDAASWRSLAMARAERERGAEAVPDADRAVDLDPFNAYGHWTRAVALLAGGGRVEEAAAAMDRALSRAGGIGHLHLAVGSVLLQLSVQDPRWRPPAMAALKEAGEILPQNFSAAWALADRLSIPPLERMDLVPEKAHAWWTVGEFWRSRGDSAQEMWAWARVVAIDPANEAAHKACLDAGHRAGTEDEARRLLGQVRAPR